MDKQKKKVTIVGSVVAAILIILLLFVSVRQQNLFGRGADQTVTAVCGDQLVISSLETCDDGNVVDGVDTNGNGIIDVNEQDGCSSTCQTETGWDCGAKGCSWNKQHFEEELRISFEQYEKNQHTKSLTIAASQDSIKKYLQNR